MIQLGSPGMQLNGVGPAAAGFTSWARPMLTALDPLPSTLYGDALPPRP